MQIAIIPILLFAIVAMALAGVIVGVGYLFNPRRTSRVKEMPYESGMDPIHDTHRRFDIRFHLLAIAFLVFDVELLFLYPWAVAGHIENGPGSFSTEESRSVLQCNGKGASPIFYATEKRGQTRKGDRHLLRLPGEHSIPFSMQKEPVPFSSPMTSFDAAVDAGWIESRRIIFAGVMFFIVLVTLGFVYDWRKGIFHWR